MSKILLQFICLFFVLTSGYTVAAQDKLTIIVTSTADDSNARDSNPGDGVCKDGFTDANPDAKPRCTLRAAIDEANAQTGDVTILVPGTLLGGSSGTYTLTRTAPDMNFNTYEDENNYGDLDLNGDFNSLEILGVGTPGPTVTAGLIDRIFDIGEDKEVRLERMNITGGTARAGRNGSADDSGVGVDGEDGDDGGAIYVGANANVELFQVSLDGNSTQSGGNGAAPATSIDRTEGGKGGNGGNGGAIYIAEGATVSIKKSTIVGNGAGDGGSPAAGQANVTMPLKGGDGGDGGNGGAIYSLGTLSITQTTIANNTGGDPSGGAAGSNDGDDGLAGEGGVGGLGIFKGSILIQNTLIGGNTAGDDTENGKQPGMDLFVATEATANTVGGNLLSTNDSVEELFESAGSVLNAANDLVGSGSGDDSNIINVQFGSLNQNSDEGIKTLPLLEGSPAIDMGGDGGSSEMFDFDGRGFTRPQGDAYDVGSYEFNGEPAPVSIELYEIDPFDNKDDQEFVEIKNTGDYPVQLADYFIAAFGEDDKAGFTFNLFNKVMPGLLATVGDPNIDEIDHPFSVEFSFEANGADDSDPQEIDEVVFSNVQGAIGLYKGDATDIPNGAAAGGNVSTREDLIVYRVRNGGGNRMDRCAAYQTFSSCVQLDRGSESSIQRVGVKSYTATTPSPGQDAVSSSLPLNWLTFTASSQGASVTLNWSTVNEFDVDKFTVQYRTAAGSWKNTGEIVATNKRERNDYAFTIKNLPAQLHYFRIQQHGIAEEVSYSPIRSILPAAVASTQITIQPNPVRNQNAQLNIALATDSAVQLSIFDTQGSLVYQTNWTPQAAGQFVQELPIQQLTAKGVYFLRLQTATEVLQQSFVVQ